MFPLLRFQHIFSPLGIRNLLYSKSFLATRNTLATVGESLYDGYEIERKFNLRKSALT